MLQTTGNDLLIGGGCRDTLKGGAGADLFRIEDIADSRPGRDAVLDFQAGTAGTRRRSLSFASVHFAVKATK